MSKIVKDGKQTRAKKDEKTRFCDKRTRLLEEEYCFNCKHSEYNGDCKLNIAQITKSSWRWAFRREGVKGPRPVTKGCFVAQIDDDKEKNKKPTLPQRGPGLRWIAFDEKFPQDGEISFIAKDEKTAMRIALIHFDYASSFDGADKVEQEYVNRINLRVK